MSVSVRASVSAGALLLRVYVSKKTCVYFSNLTHDIWLALEGSSL